MMKVITISFSIVFVVIIGVITYFFDSLSADSIANIFSALGTMYAVFVAIGVYIEENKSRQEDEKRRIQRTKKEDRIRQWNALYPHRLDFYTRFFKTYHAFITYSSIVIEVQYPHRLGTSQESFFNTKELFGFVQQFFNFSEEAKVLFDNEISDLVSNVYAVIQDFGYQPLSDIGETLQDLSVEISSNKNPKEYKALQEELLSIQSQLMDLKWNIKLREKFIQVLKLEDSKDE